MGQGNPREIGEQRGANERKHGPIQQAADLSHGEHSLDEHATSLLNNTLHRITNGIFIDYLARTC